MYAILLRTNSDERKKNDPFCSKTQTYFVSEVFSTRLNGNFSANGGNVTI